MPFTFKKQYIRDVVVIIPSVFKDNRGFFMENYKKSEFINNGILNNFVQDNYSISNYRTLRGLHYQAFPNEQAKLIKCIKGKIVDVAVDIRKDSPTFKQYLKIVLSEENNRMLFIPKGFAHGFVTLSDSAEIIYKTDSEYSQNSERGIIWNDKTLNIDWGIDFVPVLSEKDKSLPCIENINLEEIK